MNPTDLKPPAYSTRTVGTHTGVSTSEVKYSNFECTKRGGQ